MSSNETNNTDYVENNNLVNVQWSIKSNRGALNFRPCGKSLWKEYIIPPIWRSGVYYQLNSEQHDWIKSLNFSNWFCLLDYKELNISYLSKNIAKKIYNIPFPEFKHFQNCLIPTIDDYFDLYWFYLTECKSNICQLVKILSELKITSPILISCYAGKDRTGVVCCLLLSLLTNNLNNVIDDYTISESQLIKQVDFFRDKWGKLNISRQDYLKRYSNMQDIIIKLLGKVIVVYGGVEAYLKSIGVTNKMLENIRSNFFPFLK